MKNTKYNWAAIFFVVLLVGCGQSSSEEKQHEETTLTASFDCAHCGMPTNQRPKWQVRGHIGSQTPYFCSPKCMWLWESAQRKGLDSAWVLDFYTLQPLRASHAYYVAGSDVLGPMGHDLVPVSNEEAATDFASDHGGHIYPFEAVDSAVVSNIGK